MSAFCPVLPSTTSSTSCGAPIHGGFCRSRGGSSSALPSNAAWVVSRPAVSAMTTTSPRAPCLHSPRRSSPPLGRRLLADDLNLRLRSAQTPVARAAARKVSAAASKPSFSAGRQMARQLADAGRLARPFTPTTMITVGVASPTAQRLLQRLRAVRQRVHRATGARPRLGRPWPPSPAASRSSSRNCVALTPAAISSASSSSSYKASSIACP